MENIITSKDNPVIKLYQKLSTSKKERLQYGLFVLEGIRITEDAIKENSGITHLIFTESAYEKLGENWVQADLRDTKVIVISNELGNRITPSVVAFTDEERLVGEAAKNQAALNPKRTIYSATDL